jgi:hypothetical protein
MARNNQLHVRLNDAELARVDVACRRLGLNRSQYVRLVASLPADVFSSPNNPHSHEKHYVFLDPFLMHQILIEAGRWGNNYNQGVHALNLIVTIMESSDYDRRYLGEILRLAENANQFLDEGKRGIHNLVKEVRAMGSLEVVPVHVKLNSQTDALL